MGTEVNTRVTQRPVNKTVRFHVLTLSPGMFSSPFKEGVISRAVTNGLIKIETYDIRDHSSDPHRNVDDYAFGGGPGMVMKPEPVFRGVESIKSSYQIDDVPVVLMSPRGSRLTQKRVEELSAYDELILICGRYEGIDERVREHLATDEISVGDFVISGGELAAMVLIDAVSRLVPGVLGNAESTRDEPFTTGLLQFPQYTRPAEFRGWTVPDILLSGNHFEIKRWRRNEMLRTTFNNRPDLIEAIELSEDDVDFLNGLIKS